jgi:hypothetical protein
MSAASNAGAGIRLMGEALGRELRMPDGDFLKSLDAPQVAVLADGAEIEGGDAEGL